MLSRYFSVLQPCLLKKVVSILQWAIKQNNEQLARTGTECLQIVVMNNGSQFTQDSWNVISAALRDLFVTTSPQELMMFGSRGNGGEDEAPKDDSKGARQGLFNSIIIKCVVQLELIQVNVPFYFTHTRIHCVRACV